MRQGETGTALLLLADLFLLLCAYYLIKTVREPLVLATGGAEVKSYAAALQAALLIGFVPLYGWFASKVGRRALLGGVTLVFTAQLLLFALGSHLGLPGLGFAFYVWVGIFSLVAIAQFWSLANDVYTKEQGERLFPLVAVGATLGSPAGSWIAARLFESGTSPHLMLLIAAGILLAHGAIALVVHEREGGTPTKAATLPSTGGFQLVLRSRYLRTIALLFVLLNLVNTTGEYVLSRSVLIAAAEAAAIDPSITAEAFIGAFYGRFFFWVNLAALVLQALFVSGIVRYFGLGGALLVLPFVAFGVYGLVAAGAGFAAFAIAKGAENATEYSVMNTAREMLWLPTSREEKYKAKQAIDSFFVRLGDVVAAGVVFVGASVLDLPTTQFAALNLAVIAVWIALSLYLLRENRRLAGEPLAAHPIAVTRQAEVRP